VLSEVFSGTVRVQTRELADVESFIKDTGKSCWQGPQPKASPVPPPARIFPVVVISGQYPVNPLTIRHINEQLTTEGHRPDGTVQPLTVLDQEEVEGCQALLQRKSRTLPHLSTLGEPRLTATLPSVTVFLSRSAGRKSASQVRNRPRWRNVRGHPATARYARCLDTPDSPLDST